MTTEEKPPVEKTRIGMKEAFSQMSKAFPAAAAPAQPVVPRSERQADAALRWFGARISLWMLMGLLVGSALSVLLVVAIGIGLVKLILQMV